MRANFQLISTFQGYEIHQREPGFEYTPIALQKFASFVVRDEAQHLAVFAFRYSLLGLLLEGPIDEQGLLRAALQVIKQTIAAGALENRHDYTFDYRDDAFVAVRQPAWWLPSFS